MMPEGISCKAVFTPLITSVWPALCPPWKRTTPCAWSVSQSTILPLPSSPHWVPTTTTLRPGFTFTALADMLFRKLVKNVFYLCSRKVPDFFRFRSTVWTLFSVFADARGERRARLSDGGFKRSGTGLDDPRAIAFDQHAVAREFLEIVVVARQRLDHDFAGVAQRGDARTQRVVVLPRRENRAAARFDRRNPRDFAQVQRKARRRARPAIGLADVVVPAAACDRIRHAVDVRREHHAAVVRIAAQIGQIDHHFGADDLRRKEREVVERAGDFRRIRQARTRFREYRCIAVQPRQHAQRG